MASKKMSKKQKNQLIFLAVLTAALVVVMYWQYLIVPLNTAIEELEEEIESNQMAAIEMNMEISTIADYEEMNEVLTAKLTEETKDLFPIMNTEDADIMLLNYIKKSGLSASTLQVSSNISEQQETGVYIITASYEAKGSYAQLLSLIKSINAEPAVVFTSINAAAQSVSESTLVIAPDGPQTVTGEKPASEEDMTFILDLAVFMYEAPVIPDYFSDISGSGDETEETGEAGLLDGASDYL